MSERGKSPTPPPAKGGTGGNSIVLQDLGEPKYLVPVPPAKTVISTKTGRPVDEKPAEAPANPPADSPGE